MGFSFSRPFNRRLQAQLIEAAQWGDRDAVTRALAQGADPAEEDLHGDSALAHAAIESQLECLSLLLPHSDLSRPLGKLGATLPIWAAQEGRWEILGQLLYRADARQPDAAGWTPLMWAAYNGHARCVQLLLPVSTPHSFDSQGRNALMWAAFAGRHDCVALLLDDLSAAAIDNTGCTAAMLAHQHGHTALAALIEQRLPQPPAPQATITVATSAARKALA